MARAQAWAAEHRPQGTSSLRGSRPGGRQVHGGVEGRGEVERSGEVGRREEGRAREAMVEAVLLRYTWTPGVN